MTEFHFQGMIYSKQHYLDVFKVDTATLDRLVQEGISSGGSYCDIFFENTSYGSLLLRDGAVTSGGNHIDYGVGIRVLSGEKTGYAYSESTSYADMLACAKAAARIADSPSDVSPYGTGSPSRGEPNPDADRYPMKTPWGDLRMDSYLPFLRSLEAKIREKDSRIIKITVSLAFQVSDILMYNSSRELKWDTRPMGSVSATVVFSQNGKVENKSTSRSFRTGVEMLSDSLAD